MHNLIHHLITFCLTLAVLLSTRGGLAAEPSTRELLTAQLLEWVSSTEGVEGSDVTVAALDGRVRVPDCPDGFEFSFPFNDKSTVRVSCSSLSWSVVTRVTFERPPVSAPIQANNSPSQMTYALVGARPAGHILSAADVVQVPEPSTARRSAGRALSLGQIAGARLARDMSSGAALQAADIQIAHRVLTVISPLQRGSALTESNTEMMTFYGTLPADALTSLDELRRMVASTQLRPNQPLRLSNLRQLADVIRGDELIVSVSRGPVTIETPAIALDQGVIGEQIEVQNPESGETFRVIITDVGRAEPR
jgi:flagella basal body P-ring formation protein FlgA